jgi:glycosyltransferase involved in cell wall biosynthesis
MTGHILFCGINFDAKPQGINTGKLVRALLDQGVDVTVVCGKEKSTPRLEHERAQVLPVSVEPRHPAWLWRAVAAVSGHHACNHYLWTRRVSRLRPQRLPDVVYGRAWPYSSLVGAAALARAIDRPLWLHFSDPFPAPPKTAEYPYVMRGLRQIAQQARGATFTNAEEAAYQLRQLPALAPDWAQVLNHIAPPPRLFGPPPPPAPFVYIGSFSDSRPPDALLRGFARYRADEPGARIHCVGTRPEKVLPAAARYQVASAVQVEPYTRDIAAWQARASVMLAVDWLAGEPVYLLTKIVESFVVDRPVLLLTQAGSPGAKLAAQVPDTVVCVTSTDPDAVADGFRRAAALSRNPGDYAARLRLMEPFAAAQVAQRCANLLLANRAS